MGGSRASMGGSRASMGGSRASMCGSQQKVNRGIIIKIRKYLKHRAEHEGVEMNFSEVWFQTYIFVGYRLLFGITIDDDGNPLSDDQEPSAGFLKAWLEKDVGVEGFDTDRKSVSL